MLVYNWQVMNMFTAKIKCDKCSRQLQFNEEYFFHSRLQDTLGITNVKKYYQEYGTIYCKECLQKELGE